MVNISEVAKMYKHVPFKIKLKIDLLEYQDKHNIKNNFQFVRPGISYFQKSCHKIAICITYSKCFAPDNLE